MSVDRFGGLIMLPSAFEPTVCQVERTGCVVVVRRSRSAFVKCHHYVGANCPLDVHHVLRREQMLASVYVAAEKGTLFTELALA